MNPARRRECCRLSLLPLLDREHGHTRLVSDALLSQADSLSRGSEPTDLHDADGLSAGTTLLKPEPE